MTKNLREAAQQALAVINDTAYGAAVYRKEVRDVIAALRDALAERGAAMTDRDLLELAAKAAGLSLSDGAVWDDERADYVSWNPLIDDGDALRLRCKLHMSVFSNETMSWVATGMHQIVRAEEPHDGSDPYAATRRAIVRAAAEIGRAMS